MKRTFTFSAVNKATCTIEMELRQEDDKEVLHVIGDVNKVASGQCQDIILEYYGDNPLVAEICDLWKKYHLNDMNPDCEHGINEKLADKKITVNTYSQTIETITQINAIKDKIKQQILEVGTSTVSPDERTLLGLPYERTDNIPPNLQPYYKLVKTEEKTAGWVRYTEHPDGVLCKPCPICGYKYGTKWNYRPIPEKDLTRIKELIEKGE